MQSMQLGDASAGERAERSQLDEALNILDTVLNGLVDTIEGGGLDQLSTGEKISFWRRFESFRNRLPLIDHRLIANAEATDLAGQRCFSSLARLLTGTLLSPGEAASRVRAAAAVGPRTSELGEALDPVLPQLAAAQRAGQMSTEQMLGLLDQLLLNSRHSADTTTPISSMRAEPVEVRAFALRQAQGA
jgi:hypothetical protein